MTQHEYYPHTHPSPPSACTQYSLDSHNHFGDLSAIHEAKEEKEKGVEKEELIAK